MKSLKTYVCLILVAAAGLIAMPGIARAQSNDATAELGRDWNLRIGTYLFNSKTARDKAGTVAFSGLVERTVYESAKSQITVGIGYNGMGDVYSVPVTINGILTPGVLRFGVGAGYSFNKRISGEGSNGAVLSAIVGVQLGRGRKAGTIDLRYNFVSGSNNELDGLGITYGFRF